MTPNRFRFRFLLLSSLLMSFILLASVACQPMSVAEPDTPPTSLPIATEEAEEEAVVVEEEVEAEESAPVAPESEPEPEAESELAPSTAVDYDLGLITVIQDRFDEESRFRNMPVQLNGLIAAPTTTPDAPYPVVIIIHGTHPGCPVNETDVDAWPCAPEDEQPNYSGFGYLVSGLAEAGYVALSININAENTFGFGEPTSGERLAQLLQQHLEALATASAGGENNFGIPLEGQVDLSRVALVGHSRGGENIYWLTHQQEWDIFPAGNDAIKGILLIAASPINFPVVPSDIPQGQVLPACDGDVLGLDGQLFYEINRLNPDHASWMASAVLAQANHNHFNSILRSDTVPGLEERPACATLLEPEVQRQFLVDYAVDFMTALLAEDEAEVAQAKRNMGLDVTAVSPTELYGLPANVAYHPPADQRELLFVPRTEADMTTNLFGGEITAVGVTPTFCPEEFYTLDSRPGSEPCQRVTVIVPGQPVHAVLSWETQEAQWRLALPEGQGDLSGYTTLSMRVVLDPLSPLNVAGAPQQFSVQLTDSAGKTALISTSLSEAALQFPPGSVVKNEFFADGVFAGIVPLLNLHFPLADFAAVDLTQVSEVALHFDQTPSGALFLADIMLARP